MDNDTGLLFDLPSVARKKVSAAFDGGRITSDGGVALLALADRRIGVIDRIARLIADPRDPALVTHSLGSILRARVLAIATGRPVAVILRPGKTPSGREAAGYLRRLYRRIRSHWPRTRLTIRGDGHYGRPELMDFCEKHGLDYLFGVTGTTALAAKVEHIADPIRVERAESGAAAVRGFADTRHGARSWKKQRRVVVSCVQESAPLARGAEQTFVDLAAASGRRSTCTCGTRV